MLQKYETRLVFGLIYNKAEKTRTIEFTISWNMPTSGIKFSEIVNNLRYRLSQLSQCLLVRHHYKALSVGLLNL